MATTWPLLGIVKKRAHILICLQRGNHRSCQSPRHKCFDSTPCFVFKEATTEAVSRQFARALILHCTLYSKRQPQKLSAAKTQLLLYYMCYSRWWCSQRRSVLTFFFETCKKECYNKGRPEISDGFGGGLGLVWYLSQDPVSQDPGSYLPGSSLAGSSLPGSSLPGSSLPGSSLPG